MVGRGQMSNHSLPFWDSHFFVVTSSYIIMPSISPRLFTFSSFSFQFLLNSSSLDTLPTALRALYLPFLRVLIPKRTDRGIFQLGDVAIQYTQRTVLQVLTHTMARASRGVGSPRSAWMTAFYLLLVFLAPMLLIGAVRAQDDSQKPMGDDKAVSGPGMR